MKRARNINLTVQIRKRQDWIIRGRGKKTGIHKKRWGDRKKYGRKNK